MPKPHRFNLFRRRFKRKLRIRPLRRTDLADLARLFHETVARVNRRDYTPAKLRAWSPRVRPAGVWRRRLAELRTFAAVRKRKLLGFATLGAAGVIEHLYVHRKRQGRGVGRALLARLTQEARRQGLAQLKVDASITARPFFRALGFRQERVHLRYMSGRALRQYQMQRRLG